MLRTKLACQAVVFEAGGNIAKAKSAYARCSGVTAFAFHYVASESLKGAFSQNSGQTQT
jgi:hypothetical protein